MCKFCSNFAPDMKKYIYILFCACALLSCQRASRLAQYLAEKHARDSVSLTEQERSMAYYHNQLDSLLPVADSLITYFTYEKNEQYQDHGYYVINARGNVRMLVRDDGRDLLTYRDGQRVETTAYAGQARGENAELFERAKHLQIVMSDIHECEKRMAQTSLEIQKYEKRLEENGNKKKRISDYE